MPRSPSQLTIASFLKKPPDISPQTGRGRRRGVKRMLSTSPNSINLVPSKKSHEQSLETTNDSAQSQLANLGTPSLPPTPSPQKPNGKGKSASPTPPLLPYQLRLSPKSPGIKKQAKSKAKNASMKSSSLTRSSMDLNPFELQPGEEFSDVDPTSDEAAELLKETAADAAPSSPSAQGSAQTFSSPTAAVSAAIEAKIAEGPDADVFETMYSAIDFNKNNDVVASLTPPWSPPWPPFSAKNPNLFFPRVFPPTL